MFCVTMYNFDQSVRYVHGCLHLDSLVDLHLLSQRCGGFTTYSGVFIARLKLRICLSKLNTQYQYNTFRNPQATKRKIGLLDWHLIVFVFSLIVMNISIMILHILLEYFVASFNVVKIPSMEKPSAIRGVSLTIT